MFYIVAWVATHGEPLPSWVVYSSGCTSAILLTFYTKMIGLNQQINNYFRVSTAQKDALILSLDNNRSVGSQKTRLQQFRSYRVEAHKSLTLCKRYLVSSVEVEDLESINTTPNTCDSLVLSKQKWTSETTVASVLDYQILQLLKKGIWPVSLRSQIKEEVFKQRLALAQLSITTKKVSKNNNEVLGVWKLIREKASELIKSIVFKVEAVNMISKSQGSTTAGCDGLAFYHIPMKPVSRSQALVYFKDEIEKIKKDLSIKAGKTDQAFKRKGKLTKDREFRRRWLKSKDAALYVRKIKKRLKVILKDPLLEAKKDYKLRLAHNNELRFKLLQVLKPNKLLRYKSDYVKMVFVSKGKNKLCPFGISVLKDRVVQMLFKLVMEAYLEPLGDPYSFGFRPGRGCSHAVAEVANRVRYDKRGGKLSERSRAFGSGKKKVTISTKKQNNGFFYAKQFIIESDIKGCFNNISHTWLIDNVPMPVGFEFILFEFLKAKKLQPDGSIEERSVGVPQGGIISPLLANWALDGLDNILKRLPKEYYEDDPRRGFFYDVEKEVFLRKRGLVDPTKYKGNLRMQFSSRYSLWFVRYADEFIIGLRGKNLIPKILTVVQAFLKERGLELSEKRVKVQEMRVGTKFKFLGWVFHLIYPSSVNWMVQAPKLARGKLKDWKGVYTYPSPEATKKFRKQVVRITSSANTYKSVYTIVLELGSLIRSWDAYYTGGRLQILKRKLDWFIAKRCRMFLYKKYKGKYGGYLQEHLKLRGKWSPLHVKLQNNSIHSIPEMWKSPNIPFMFLENSKKLLNNSYLVYPQPYLKRVLLLSKLKKEKPALLYYSQKGVCPICSFDLVDESIYDSNIQFKINSFPCESYIFNLEGVESNNIKYNSNVDFDYILNPKWYTGLAIDHIIPKGLANQYPAINKILGFDENLRLVHVGCHKKKTQLDRTLYSWFKRSITFYIRTYINSLSKEVRADKFPNQFPSTVKLNQLSENIKSSFLQTALYNILDYIRANQSYTHAYIKTSRNCIEYKKSIRSLFVINKLNITLAKPNSTALYNISKVNKIKKPYSHRLKALKIRKDKKSQKFR